METTTADNLQATFSKVTGLYIDYNLSNGVNDYMSDDLPDTCVFLGKITDDGLDAGALTSSGSPVFAADGSKVLTLEGDVEGEIKASLLAVDSYEANRAVYGEESVVKTANGVLVQQGGTTPPPRRLIFQIMKSDGRVERFIVMKGQVVQDGSQVFVYNDVTSLPILINPSADEASGKYTYRVPIRGAVGTSKVAVNISSEGDGDVSPVGLTLVAPGSDLEITAEPAEGAEIINWVVDGVNTHITEEVISLPNVSVSHTVKVIFSK